MNNETPHPGIAFLADMFGPSTGDSIYICSLLNGDACNSEAVNERHVATREVQDIEGFVNKYDRAGRGAFFCVSTVRPNSRRRAKDTISEITGLHVDIDFKDTVETPEEIRRVLKQVMHPPSKINASGHGLHCFWLFKEAIEATPENIADVERLLRLLADHLGGDMQAAELARLLRLPGTHNTKNGEWLEVVTEINRPVRYCLDDMQDWLEVVGPVIHRRAPEGGNGRATNPWLEISAKYGFKPPVDVEQRLGVMQFQGADDSAIHTTQLSVSASLLTAGKTVDEVVELLLDATRVAAGKFGENWNWGREERAIRKMCEDWLGKHPLVIRQDPPPPAAEADTDTDTHDKVDEEEESAVDEPVVDTTKKRPVIRIVAGQLPRIVEEAQRALIDAGFQIFVRTGTLMYLVTATLPAADGRTTRVTKFKEIVPDLALKWLARAAEFIRYDKRSEEWVKIDPPRQLASTLLVSGDEWMFPEAVGIISSPALRPDGSLLVKPGYDPATQLYLALDPALRLPPLSDSPSRAKAEAALELLKDLLAGFEFPTLVDKSVALSLILTAVSRSAMSVAPLHLVRAAQSSTGKTHLVDAATSIATGRICPVVTAAKSEEEAEKRLGALLREGLAVIALDNCSRDLSGDLLCQLAERPLVRTRILGLSEIPEFECKATICATGNNVGPAGDMIRRTLVCNLTSAVERPELRTFTFNPIEHVLEKRGDYLAAVLTIIRAYQAAGSPPQECPPIGSYGKWSSMVRAPLIWLGEADPVASMEAARSEDTELCTIREFFANWHRHITGGQASYSAFEVAEVATDKAQNNQGIMEFKLPAFRDLLLGIAGDHGTISTRKLGWWFRKIQGRIVGGLKLEVVSDKSRVQKFRVTKAESDAEPSGRTDTQEKK